MNNSPLQNFGIEPTPIIVETRRGGVECAIRGEGPAVLLVHGAMGGYDQALLLARATVAHAGFQLVAISRPGFLSTPLALGRKPEEQADLFADVLEVLGISEAAVLALSSGGQCALQFALRHPKRCSGLALVSASSAQLHGRPHFNFRLMKLTARLPPVIAAVHRKAAMHPDRAATRSIRDPELRARTLNDPEAGKLLMALKFTTMDRMAQRLSGTQNDITQSHVPFDYPFEQIAAPVLIVHGTADEGVPYAHAESLAARLPRAELFTIEGGQHLSLFTHHREVRERVTNFLCAHAPPA